MRYVGPIVCPNCECPISSDAAICPYCHSMAAATAPWKTPLTIGWLIAILAVLVGLLCCDRFLGTDLMRQLWGFVQAD